MARVSDQRSGTGTVRRLAGWLAPYRLRVGLAVGLTALACLLNLPLPLLIQGVVDDVAAGGRWPRLLGFILVLLAVFGLQAGISLVNTFVIGRVGQGVVRDLRHQLYAQLQRLELSY